MLLFFNLNVFFLFLETLQQSNSREYEQVNQGSLGIQGIVSTSKQMYLLPNEIIVCLNNTALTA